MDSQEIAASAYVTFSTINMINRVFIAEIGANFSVRIKEILCTSIYNLALCAPGIIRTRLDEINKQMMTHKHIYKKLQRQKEMYLTGERKVKKYESCLKTTELSRYCNAHKLSSSQLKATDKSIRHFQTKLNNKKQEASEIAKRYQILLTKEKTTRNALLLLEKELLDDIQFNLVERIQSGLVCLKYILASQTNKFYELLPQIDNFDCRLAAELIIAKLSSKYQFSSPNWRGVDFLVQ
ncbi:unnamed protein product [Mytilus edulis]|uniref:Uncharacterized protein n=1 Tax=Mytilus edulis TaxID=6550 RepID=A0A8S3UFC9_MYTED|nr:unnamed protein product [Mytilus edulis]